MVYIVGAVGGFDAWGTVMGCWQAGQLICDPQYPVSHSICLPQREQKNLNSAITFGWLLKTLFGRNPTPFPGNLQGLDLRKT
jgi:hypothetical protein